MVPEAWLTAAAHSACSRLAVHRAVARWSKVSKRSPRGCSGCRAGATMTAVCRTLSAATQSPISSTSMTWTLSAERTRCVAKPLAPGHVLVQHLAHAHRDRYLPVEVFGPESGGQPGSERRSIY